MSRKVLIILPKLCDFGGNPKKKWYVFFSFRNAKSGKMERFRIWNGFSGKQPVEQRYAAARKLIDELTIKLKAGWDPFEDDKEVIYEDQLRYSHIAAKQGRLRQGNRTFNYYFTLWLDERRPNISPATYTTYKSKLRIFEQYLDKRKLTGVDARSIDTQDAERFITYLVNDRKLGNTMVRQYLLVLNMVFRSMIKKNLINYNPFENMKMSKAPKIPAKYFNDTILAKIKAVILKHDPQLWMAALFQYYCFIRPGELRFLKIADIDFDKGSIQIKGSIAKNRKTQSVVIPDSFKKYLESVGLQNNPGDYYIVSNAGIPGPVPVSKNFLYNRFVKIRKMMKLSKDYKFYSFKHTGAVKASQLIPIKDLQMQLRHGSLDQVDSYLRQMSPLESYELRNLFPEI